MVPIFTTGNGQNKQYAQREDGIWFVRYKRPIPLPGWGAWMQASIQDRPLGLWCVKIKARLPK